MNEILCDRYQILNPLGSGGFGETFLAVDLHSPTQRKVVVKALKSVNHNTSSEIIEKLFLKEAQVLEELGQKCPQIPTLYAYFCQDDKYYLVQEYIEGKNLSQSGILSSDRCLTILTSLLDTLKYVHNKNIIHRDIKPENIIIRASDGLPVLIDFGAVKETMGSFNTSSGSTVSSVVIGTRGFIAPEQSMGRTVFSTDLFALGLTMIYSLTGKYPIELPSNNLTGELEWQNLVANLHPSLARVLEKAIKIEISNRYLTAEAMQEDLYLSQFQTVAVVPPKGDNVKTSNISIEKNTDPIPVVQPPVSQPIYPEPEINTSSNSYTKQNDKSSSNILIILLILILALLGSLVGFFIIQNINQTQQKLAEIEQEKEEIKSQLSEDNTNQEKEELEALKKEIEKQRLEAERLYQQAQREKEQAQKTQETPTNSERLTNQETSYTDYGNSDPTNFIVNHYQNLNNRNYEQTWSNLTYNFTSGFSYQEYKDWWNSVSEIIIDNVDIISENNDYARIKIDLRYRMKDGRIVNDKKPYIDLIWSYDNSQWLINQKSN